MIRAPRNDAAPGRSCENSGSRALLRRPSRRRIRSSPPRSSRSRAVSSRAAALPRGRAESALSGNSTRGLRVGEGLHEAPNRDFSGPCPQYISEYLAPFRLDLVSGHPHTLPVSTPGTSGTTTTLEVLSSYRTVTS